MSGEMVLQFGQKAASANADAAAFLEGVFSNA